MSKPFKNAFSFAQFMTIAPQKYNTKLQLHLYLLLDLGLFSLALQKCSKMHLIVLQGPNNPIFSIVAMAPPARQI